MFLDYLKEEILKESKKVDQILSIDNEENGTNYSLDYLLKIIDKEINLSLDNIDMVLLEGNTFILIKILNDYNLKIIVPTKDNYGINNWIYSKYIDYSDHNKCTVEFTNSFILDNNKVAVIGSKAFVDDYKDRIKSIKEIVFE